MERLEAGEKVALLYSVNNNYQMFGIRCQHQLSDVRHSGYQPPPQLEQQQLPSLPLTRQMELKLRVTLPEGNVATIAQVG